jgi:lipoprotein-releasing system permease protein
MPWTLGLLLKRRRRGAIALTGIALGIAVLVVVTALMDGYRRGLYEGYSRLYPPLLVEPLDPADPLPPAFAARAAVAGVRFLPGFLFTRPGMPGEFVQVKVVEGLAAAEVGAELARQLGVREGGPLRLMVTGGRGPRMAGFTVGRIFASGLYEVDRRWVRVPPRAGLEGGAFFWEVTPRTRADYEALAALRDGLAPRFTLLTLEDLQGDLFASLAMQEWSMVVVLSLITMVAAFQVLSRLLLDFRERERTLGILLALGMTPGRLAGAFFSYGLWVGAGGVAAGLLGGAAAAWLLNLSGLLRFGEGLAKVYLVDRITLVLEPAHLALLGAGGLALVALASAAVLPRFFRLEPLEALRFE